MSPGVPDTDRRAVAAAPRNTVILCGRVSAATVERTLPSGDTIVTTRVVVDREQPSSARTAATRPRQKVDAIDCVAWAPRPQRTIRSWQPGDRVYVEGAIRRRFYRGGGGVVSRVEVEVLRARRLSTAPPP